jgi:hypothetical protein
MRKMVFSYLVVQPKFSGAAMRSLRLTEVRELRERSKSESSQVRPLPVSQDLAVVIPCGFHWTCSDCKFVESRAREAYDARDSGLNRKFRLQLSWTKMKKFVFLLGLMAFAIPCMSQQKTICSPGDLDFKVIQGDQFGNLTAGFTSDQAKWFEQYTAKTYPKLKFCYNPDALISFSIGIISITRRPGTLPDLPNNTGQTIGHVDILNRIGNVPASRDVPYADTEFTYRLCIQAKDEKTMKVIEVYCREHTQLQQRQGETRVSALVRDTSQRQELLQEALGWLHSNEASKFLRSAVVQ